jgi:integrase
VKGTVTQVPVKRTVTPTGRTRVSGGQWKFQVTLHPGPNGQVTRRRFARKKDAEQALATFLAERGRGNVRRALVQPSTQPLAQYLDGWLAARAPSLKPATLSSYRTIAANWIDPVLGDILLRDLTGDRIQRWHVTLRTEGVGGRPLSSRSVQYASRVLAMSLADAVEAGLLPSDPMTEIPRRQRPQHRPVRDDSKAWDLDEARRFLAAVADDRQAPLWSLALSTGARRGELLALRWADVDLDEGVIHVSRTRTPVGSTVVETSPKNAKPRDVDLDPATVASLRRWKGAQAAERLRAGEAWTDGDYVFCDEVGRAYHPMTISSRFNRAVAKVDVPPLTFHGMRLVDADAPQPIQPIAKGFDVGPHPGDDRPDGAPSDAHQLGHRALRTLRYQPGHGLIEGQRVPGAVPRPRHMRHDHAVLGAADPRRVCLHEHTDRARIQRPPATPSLSGVVAATPPTADTAPASRRPRSPHLHDQLTAAVPFELDTLNNCLLDAQQGAPYPGVAHAVPRSPVPDP